MNWLQRRLNNVLSRPEAIGYATSLLAVGMALGWLITKYLGDR